MEYELLKTDPKYSKKSYNSKVKQGETRLKPNTLKQIKKSQLAQALYYLIVLLIIMSAFLFINKLSKSSNQIKLNQVELKSTQFKLKELNDSYTKVLQEKATTDAEKASQDARVKELERQKTELEQQLQSKLAEKQRVASIQTAQVFAAQANCGSPKMCIYMKESGNNPLAVNSIGCRGIGQACPGSKLPCGADYACQDAWFTNYAIQRYGSWDAAWVFWQANHWW